MPRQLYLQCVMMSELIRTASEEVTMYFAQRRPRELAKFEWTIDAKDLRSRLRRANLFVHWRIGMTGTFA